MSRKAFIVQSNYIPWKGYFDAINRADVFVLYDDMQYTRRDWRNRNRIKTPNGTAWLTIPVQVKGKYLQKINETAISDLGWNEAHWKTIAMNYARAPHFGLYKDLFEDLYLNCRETMLSAVNHRFIRAICDMLGITTEIRWSSEFELRGDRNERLLNLCLDLGADEYLSGPSAGAYLDAGLWQNRGVNITFLDYSGYPEYPQLFGTFEHAVSVIDLLFNTGADAGKYMKSFA